MFIQKPTKESTLVLHRLVVEKHGSHNQSSHGGKGGGAGGGGGGAILPERKTPFSEERIASEINDVRDKARDITNDLTNNPNDDPTRDLAQKKAFSMRESLDKASRAKTLEGKKAGLKSARSKIPAIIDLLEDQNYNSEAGDFDRLSTNITSVMTMLPRGK